MSWKNLSEEELIQIVEKHEKWLQGEKDGERAEFSQVSIHDIRIEGENLEGAIFSDCSLRNVDFISSSLEQTRFSVVNFENCIFQDSNFANTIFEDVFFTGIQFRGCSMTQMSMRFSDMLDANFLRCKLLN